jgi:hypothetical protein
VVVRVCFTNLLIAAQNHTNVEVSPSKDATLEELESEVRPCHGGLKVSDIGSPCPGVRAHRDPIDAHP